MACGSCRTGRTVRRESGRASTQILLPLNGIYILENMNTEEMVKDQKWEFLFTLGPSRITGAVQAIINPIAIK